MKFTNRADLLIAAGESIKMQEKAGIDPMCKIGKQISRVYGTWFCNNADDYEFPLAVVEGKPVFNGDVLYCTHPDCYQCKKNGTTKFIVGDEESDGINPDFSETTWNPPKPKTVMVELLREDAEWLSRQAQERLTETYALDRAGMACRKALEAK